MSPFLADNVAQAEGGACVNQSRLVSSQLPNVCGCIFYLPHALCPLNLGEQRESWVGRTISLR